MEEYITGQLAEPTDDIDKLLRGVAQLMEDSKWGKVSRSLYYDELLGIPAIKKILKIKDTDTIPEGTCPPAAKAPLAMLATTFGIALEWQVKNGPFPGLSSSTAKGLWDNGLKKNEYRDTGEQLRWFIDNMSTTQRLKKLEAKVTVATSEQKKILQAAEKARMLDDRPASLTSVKGKFVRRCNYIQNLVIYLLFCAYKCVW